MTTWQKEKEERKKERENERKRERDVIGRWTSVRRIEEGEEEDDLLSERAVPTSNGGMQKWELGRNTYTLRWACLCTDFVCSVGA